MTRRSHQDPTDRLSPEHRRRAVPPWHAQDVDLVLNYLEVDPSRGVESELLARRTSRFGANALAQKPPRPWWQVLARQFASPLIYILFVAAVLALALGHVGDAGVILAVVVVNALIGSVQEGRAERSMAALRRLSTLQVRVLRSGREKTVPASELVPGDLMLLAAGDAIGADARLVEAAQLQVAEAALTGEAVPVTKAAAPLPEATALADRRSMVYSGTHVTAGRATAVVVATGAYTEVGRIARLTSDAEEPDTPLERRIAQFGRWLVAAALGLFAAVVALGLLRELPLAEVLMVAISQMVSMVPEGLPVAMTIALAVGMQRMAARGAIIRRLSAVETLGSTTVICSDKTGTLTRNEMTVKAVWLPDGREVAIGGSGYAPEGAMAVDGAALGADDPALAPLLQAAALCNDAELLPPEGERSAWSVLGDPTEAALRVLAAKAGVDLAALARDAPREAELPFDADSKLMATRHRMHDAPRRVWIKGAPEAVLRLTREVDAAELTQAARQAADAMAGQALRVLALATVDDDALDADGGFDALAGRARLLGLVGQIDPPREEVRQAVAECHAAGMRAVMVTGDHKLTGLAIARELGIARDEDRAVDGPELERMGEAELRAALPQIAVFARVQPAQKLRIVEALQAERRGRRDDRRRRQRRAGAGARRCRRRDGHHRHRGRQERGQDRHHRRQLRHHRRRGRAGPGGLRQPEEGDPVPVRDLAGRGGGAAAGAVRRPSAAAGGGADPVDQHRHRGHGDGEPGDGPARRRRDAAPPGGARRPPARQRAAARAWR